MDIASLSTALKQFLDISESSGISNDSAFKAPKENQPNAELVAEFESYMQEIVQSEAIQADAMQTENIQSDPVQAETVKKPDIIENDIFLHNNPEPVNNLIKIDDIAPLNSPVNETTKIEGQHIADNTTDRFAVEPQEYLQEIQEIFKHIDNNNLSTAELFRLQYLTSMLNVQISQNNSMSQSTTQQFETVLKQQG